jgi:hypothetical protein
VKSFIPLLLPAAILLSANTDPAPAKENSAQTDADKMICRREASGTGSIMPKRVCHTKAEWDALAESAQNDLDRIRAQDRSKGMIGRALGR